MCRDQIARRETLLFKRLRLIRYVAYLSCLSVTNKAANIKQLVSTATEDGGTQSIRHVFTFHALAVQVAWLCH